MTDHVLTETQIAEIEAYAPSAYTTDLRPLIASHRALAAENARLRVVLEAAETLRRVAIGGATVDERQPNLLAAAWGHTRYSYMTFTDGLEAWVALCDAAQEASRGS